MQSRYFYDFFAFVYFETASSIPDIRQAMPFWTRAKYMIGRSIGLSRFYPRDMFLIKRIRPSLQSIWEWKAASGRLHFVSLFIRPIGISGILKKKKILEL